MMGSTLLLSALHAPPAAAAPAPADDGSDVRSLVERALQAWTDEFTLVRSTHTHTCTSKQPCAARQRTAAIATISTAMQRAEGKCGRQRLWRSGE